MHAETSFLYEGAILLGFALVFVLLFRRLGLGATLGYLVAGAVVGPHVLDLAGDAANKISFAELGIAFLLFVVGLELNPARLWRMKSEIFGLGLLQVAACGAALVGVFALTTSYPFTALLVLGLPLALSSTAQVLPMLQSAGRLRTPFGERAFSILLFQDLSIIPLITMVAALSVSGAEDGPGGWLLALYTVFAVAGLIALGRFAIRPLFRLIANLREREFFVVAALFTIVAAAALMHLLGLSVALGAFIAGVMLADTPYRHELEADVEPFRSILLGLFFLAVGMMLDLGAIAQQPLFVVGMALALIATKAAVVTAIGLAFRMEWRSAIALGLLLSQGGEFGFVLFTQAQAGGIIDAQTASLFGAVVTLSMVTTPFLMMLTRRIRKSTAGQPQTREGPKPDGANAVVVGYGRFGQTVAQMLMAGGVKVTTVDTDVEMIDTAGSFGAKIYFGDGLRLDILRQAGAAEANLIAFCMDGDPLERELLEGVKQAFPQAALYVRAFDRRTAIKLAGSPVEGMVREVRASAITLARMALDGLGLGLDDINRAEDYYRGHDESRLAIQKEAGDVTAARDQIITRPAPRGEGGGLA